MTSHTDRDALLWKSEKMAIIGEMTRGVAHEFNNVFHGIVGSLEVTRKLIAKGRASDSERFVDAAIASARGASSLTRRLLECAQAEPANPRTVDVSAMLQSLQPLLRASLPPATQVDIPPAAEGVAVCCDANEFEIAILALFVSVIGANQGGGTVTVRADGDVQPFVHIRISHSAAVGTGGTADHPALLLAERFARGAGGDIIVGESGPTIRLPRESMPS